MKNFLNLILITISVSLGCTQDIEPYNKHTAQKTSEEPINQNAKKTCACLKGIGSSLSDKPIINHSFNNGMSLVVCGFHDKEMVGDGLIVSEFEVFNCSNGESLVQYDATQICRIIESSESVIIKELQYLPAGKNWSWELIQIGEQKITSNSKNIVCSKLKPKLELEMFAIDKKDQTDFLNTLVNKKRHELDAEDVIFRLEVMSLLGNKKAWNILKNYEMFRGEKADGGVAEALNEAVLTTEWILTNE